MRVLIIGVCFVLNCESLFASDLTQRVPHCSITLRKSRSIAEFSKIIAQPPYDDMGQEFAGVFGNFLFQNRADPDRLTSLAVEAFAARLDLAKKYKTFFSQQMEPVDLQGQVTKLWLQRFKGESHFNSWSYGIAGHWRADEIHKILTAQLKDKDFDLQIIEVPSPLPFPYQGERSAKVKHWDFSENFETFKMHAHIYELDAEHFLILHPQDRDVPQILDRLEVLWKFALDRNNAFQARLRALADFEWTWFWLNPFGRAGATTGDSLSHLVQFEIEAEGHPIQVRHTFHAQDIEALARRRSTYIETRIKDWLEN